MHGPNDHTTHFPVWIVKSIWERRSLCRWATTLNDFCSEIVELRSWVGTSMNVGDVECDRVLQASLTRTRATITRTQNRLNEYNDQPDDVMLLWGAEKRENLRAKIEQEIEGGAARRVLATCVGYRHQL